MVFSVWTLKASYSKAQGKRSGVSRKAPPWGTVPISSSTLKGLHNILSHPFRVPGLSDFQPRAALRLALGYGVQPLRGWSRFTTRNKADQTIRVPLSSVVRNS